MRDREAFSYAFFIVTFIIAVFFTVHSTEYIAYTARAVTLPMFLISVLEFLNRIRFQNRSIYHNQKHIHTFLGQNP